MMSSRQDFLKWMFGVAFTVAAILGVAHGNLLADLAGAETRGPASVDPAAQAPATEAPKKLPEVVREKQDMSKGSSVVVVKIASSGALKAGGTATLTATVEAQSDLKDLKFAWIMPKEGGVNAVGGPLEGDLGELKAGATSEVRLTIEGTTDDARLVHLHVYRMADGEAMGQMATYNTGGDEASLGGGKIQSKAELIETNEGGDRGHRLMQ